MRFSDILHYVQNNREKAKRNERLVEQAKSQIRETLDGLSYPDAIYFTSHVVSYLNSYLDERSRAEVYRSVASWELDEGRKPCCIRIKLDPAALNGVDRVSHTANLVILIERIANAFMPKDTPLKAFLDKSGVIELTGDGDSKTMKRCMSRMQAHQNALRLNKSKMH